MVAALPVFSMGYYTQRIQALTDSALAAELAKCSRQWWDYGDPATDKHYWYRELLTEDQRRKRTQPKTLTVRIR